MEMQIYRTELNERHHNILVKEGEVTYEDDILNSPGKVDKLMRLAFRMDKRAEEYVYIIGLNSASKVLGIFETSHGAVNRTVLRTREIFIRLLLVGASGFMVVHNHPSGRTSPSKEDKDITEKIKKVGELLDIPLIDHVIIGENGRYFSFAEEKVL